MDVESTVIKGTLNCFLVAFQIYKYQVPGRRKNANKKCRYAHVTWELHNTSESKCSLHNQANLAHLFIQKGGHRTNLYPLS